jgi:hypothetical protein
MKKVEAGENHVKRSSVICVYHRILLGKSNKGLCDEGVGGGVCNTFRKDENCNILFGKPEQ